MNTTDILFNTGQWNWDSISTISNIILVLARVIITRWYARQVRKQTILGSSLFCMGNAIALLSTEADYMRGVLNAERP
uniref:Uncharacterized protein n=1 Tax=Candidatus Methanophaga sp. ANME-1 ERB7 TaxID=2759913 RepID=A0A7G9ZBK9_9EURY|nr:hypothetical protein LLBILDAL_00002 [Methanosarcinales archaeon ANME-1 ERB7]